MAERVPDLRQHGVNTTPPAITTMEGAIVIDEIKNKDDTPTMRGLNRYVIKKYAADWKDVGIELGLEFYSLKIIEKDHPQQSVACFQETLDQWLKLTPNATWRTLEVALTNVKRLQVNVSPAFTSQLKLLTDNLKERYKLIRFQNVEDEWPPNQPKIFVSVTLVHHEGEQTQQELIDLSRHDTFAIHKLSSPRVIKSIPDVFSFLDKHIVIEGAPGIGKTILAKEISHYWANDKILVGMNLFLLFVRDSYLHSVKSVSELIDYLNNDCLNSTEAKLAAQELMKSNGVNMVFVWDGYDECPPNCPLKKFIDKLISGECLPNCVMVITSRPSASLSLRWLVKRRLEILGFSRESQDLCISASLKESPDKKKKLKQYLKEHPIINSLLYNPLHLTVLLYLFKQGDLPETLTEMNETFIIHTIFKHMEKQDKFKLGGINKLSDLPNHICKFVHKLSELAFKGLQENRLVFTFDEIKTAANDVWSAHGVTCGFGLLQAVENYSVKGIGTNMSLNFLHFTMQECLAALYVSNLPVPKQSSLLKTTFWDGQFNFMWIMYVGIVGLQSNCFTELFNSIEQNDTRKPIKLLYIFQCCLEEKNSTYMPLDVTSIFSDGNISLRGITLLPHHVLSLTFFMMKSSMKWKSLDLTGCFIGIEAINILAKFSLDYSEIFTTIDNIRLTQNNLTSLWGNFFSQYGEIDSHSLTVIANSGFLFATILDLSHNWLGKNGTIELMLGLHSNTKLTVLNISNNTICDSGAAAISDCLKANATLKKLDISGNSITDKGAKWIAEALQTNATLQNFNISSNKLSDDGAMAIGGSIPFHKTLLELHISKNWITKCGVKKIVLACINNRTLQKLTCTHNNISEFGYIMITELVRKEKAVEIFEGSWNRISNKDERLAIETKIYSIGMFGEKEEYVGEELWYANDITCINHRKEFVECYVKENSNVEINIQPNCYGINVLSIILKAMEINWMLRSLDISNSNLSNDGVVAFSNCLRVNTTLQEVDLSRNGITSDGVKWLTSALRNNSILRKLNLSENMLFDCGAKEIAGCFENNKTLQELNISKNWISKEGVMGIVVACTKNRTLHKLVCTENNLSKPGLMKIIDYIRQVNAVKLFEGSWNNVTGKMGELVLSSTIHLLDVCSETVIVRPDHYGVSVNDLPVFSEAKILDCCLQENDSLQVGYSNYLFCRIILALKFNRVLQSLDISGYFLSNDQAIILSQYLIETTTLTELRITNITFYEDGEKLFTKGLRQNRTLQKLSISKNSFRDEGNIINFLKSNATLIELTIAENKGAEWFFASFEIKTLQKLVMGDYNNKYHEVNNVVTVCSCLNTIITELNLSHYIVDGDVVVCIADSLIMNESLRRLHIVECYLPEDAVVAISNSLKVNATVTALNISGNKISDDGAVYISDCLKINTTLQELNISENLISKEGVMRIVVACTKNRTLHKLVCTHNNLSKSGLAEINDYIRKENAVEIFEGSWKTISSLYGSPAIKTTFIWLDLSLQDLGKVIYLDCRSLSDFWFEDIRRLFSTTVNLNHCEMIHNIDFSGSKLHDDEAKSIGNYLKTNTTLIKLNISRNIISNNGASSIASSLLTNSTLQNLDVSRNVLLANGALSFSECLKANKTLIELDISFNSITDRGAQYIAEALQNNSTVRRLDISGNRLSNYGAIAIGDSLKTNTTLLELSMSDNSIFADGAKCLAEGLQRNSALLKLDISINELSDCGVLAILNAATTLLMLDISDNGITNEGAQCMAHVLHANKRPSKNDLEPVTSLTLIELKMGHNNCITANGMRWITDILCTNTTLQKLDISWNELCDDGGVIVGGYLKVNTPLLELNISHNSISRKGAKMIAAALQINETLIKLDLSGNQLSNDGTAVIMDSLRNNTALLELNLSLNNITTVGAKSIAKVLQINKTLQKFDISCNELSDGGVVAISDCLKYNTTLAELNLSDNYVTIEGVKQITTTFQESSVLRILDLSHNKLSCCAVSRYLAGNVTLAYS